MNADEKIREALDQIIRDADGWWPVAREAILASATIRRIRESAWDEGFDAGHYINAEESRDCGCNNNPYRESP